MKLSCLVLIFLANILLRSSAYPFQIYRLSCLPFVLIAGLLSFADAILRRRKLLIKLAVTDTKKEVKTTTPKPLCSDGYTIYLGPGRSFCYRIASSCRNWDDARMVCNAEGADLLVLDDDSLIPFSAIVKKDFPSDLNCQQENSVWIGAKTMNIIPTAEYIDGTRIRVGSPLWALGEPSTAENCVYIGTFGPREFIADERCFLELSFVCQQQI